MIEIESVVHFVDSFIASPEMKWTRFGVPQRIGLGRHICFSILSTLLGLLSDLQTDSHDCSHSNPHWGSINWPLVSRMGRWAPFDVAALEPNPSVAATHASVNLWIFLLSAGEGGIGMKQGNKRGFKLNAEFAKESQRVVCFSLRWSKHRHPQP